MKYSEAEQKYLQALALLEPPQPQFENGVEEKKKEEENFEPDVKNMIVTLHSNIAACLLQMVLECPS